MSHINEALKKAQKERDARHLAYEGLFASSGKKRRVSGGKVLGWTLACGILIAVVFQYRSWQDEPDTQPVTATEDNLGKSTPVNEPTAVEKAREYYNKARVFQKKGLLNEAKRLYQDGLKLDPGYVDALNNIGVIFIRERNFAAAQRHFEKAIRLNPAYADPFYNLACLYAIKGELKESLALLKRAVSIDSAARDWAQRDTDLENLRGTPEFISIVGNAELPK